MFLTKKNLEINNKIELYLFNQNTISLCVEWYIKEFSQYLYLKYKSFFILLKQLRLRITYYK